MNRSKSSRRWLAEHFADPFVKRAQAEGMRSRAVYKLEELLERDQLLKPGMVVVDLGAAPGGWSQLVRRELGERGRVIALDILEMPPLAGVEFIHGDFREPEPLSQLEAALGGALADLVLSDMAPNISGIASMDQARAVNLAEMALEFACGRLAPEGAFLVKTFQGAGYPDFRNRMREAFRTVASRKPAASRDRSSEQFLLGRGLKAPAQG